jgi:hypothetical protein
MRIVPEEYAKKMRNDFDLDDTDYKVLLAKVHQLIRQNTLGQAKMDLNNIETWEESVAHENCYPETAEGIELFGMGDKGKGKGKGFQGHCYDCGGWGHTGKNCPTRGAGGKDKGKGKSHYDKGKGKGKKGDHGKGDYGKGGGYSSGYNNYKGYDSYKGKGKGKPTYAVENWSTWGPSQGEILGHMGAWEYATPAQIPTLHLGKGFVTSGAKDCPATVKDWQVAVKHAKLPPMKKAKRQETVEENRFAALQWDRSDEVDELKERRVTEEDVRERAVACGIPLGQAEDELMEDQIMTDMHEKQHKKAPREPKCKVNGIHILTKHGDKCLGTMENESWEPLPHPLVIDSGAARQSFPRSGVEITR